MGILEFILWFFAVISFISCIRLFRLVDKQDKTIHFLQDEANLNKRYIKTYEKALKVLFKDRLKAPYEKGTLLEYKSYDENGKEIKKSFTVQQVITHIPYEKEFNSKGFINNYSELDEYYSKEIRLPFQPTYEYLGVDENCNAVTINHSAITNLLQDAKG